MLTRWAARYIPKRQCHVRHCPTTLPTPAAPKFYTNILKPARAGARARVRVRFFAAPFTPISVGAQNKRATPPPPPAFRRAVSKLLELSSFGGAAHYTCAHTQRSFASGLFVSLVARPPHTAGLI
jgi:hypothetical protein